MVFQTNAAAPNAGREVESKLTAQRWVFKLIFAETCIGPAILGPPLDPSNRINTPMLKYLGVLVRSLKDDNHYTSEK
jgi:hypothetical protein